jgi:FixJ family two-component response regulator
MPTRPLVSIVNADESVRKSVPDLLRQFGFDARAFSSAEAFLDSPFVGAKRCLILDSALPGMSGPDLQRELADRGHGVPIVFITASGDGSVRSLITSTTIITHGFTYAHWTDERRST